MADDDYDPLDPPTWTAADEQNDGYDPTISKVETGDGDDDDEDDYDPDSFATGDTTDQATPADAPTPVSKAAPSRPASTAPQPTAQAAPVTQPKTVGGFIMDESDDEENIMIKTDSPPPPSQLNGTAGAHSGLGAAAISHAQDVLLGSEPTPDAAPAIIAPQTNALTGASTDTPPSLPPEPASVPDATSQTLPSISVAASDPLADSGSVLTPSAQPSTAPTPVPAQVNGMAPAQSLQTVSIVPQRLAHDIVGQLEDRIKGDPKADTDAWMGLIAYYKDKDQLDNARKVYQRFFELFPTAASVWLEYANFEQDNGETMRVEQILGVALMKVLDIRMWHFYLNFLRRRNPLINDADGSKRALISSVFDVVLDKVGIDPEAGDLWREYIDFLKAGPGTVGGSGWQDMQKVDLLRKAYQRAIALPHDETIKLWKEYDSFEIGLNRATGRKNLNEQGAAYMTAKGAKTQLDKRITRLDRKGLPKLPPAYDCAGEDEFGDQVVSWRDWIEWEKADELVLKEEENGAQYRKRVLYVYKQATVALRFYPDIWYEAATWCFDQELPDIVEEGSKFLDDGISANPESVLLALKKADRVESALPASTTDEIAIDSGDKVEVVYEGIHKALYGLRDKYNEREKAAQAQVHEHFASLTPEEDVEKQDADMSDDEDSASKPKTRKEQLDAQLAGVKATFDAQRDVLKRSISSVWCAKMRAFRRIQGQGKPKEVKKGFRGVFGEARPRGMLTSEVYICSALLEHHCYRDPAATKIFDRGLKLFPIDEAFALEYLKHLLEINDFTNAKAVFETTLTKIQSHASLTPAARSEKCRPLLGWMHAFESRYGDLGQIHRLEKRMAELYPLEPDLMRFTHRFETPTFDALKAQLVLSPTQIRPKTSSYAQPPQQQFNDAPQSPPDLRLGLHGPYVSSPKRPLPLDNDSDVDTPARKHQRFDRQASPRRTLPPAANAAQGGSGGFVTKSYVPGSGPVGGGAGAGVGGPVGPTPLPRDVVYLLSILPNALEWRATRLDGGKMVGLLQGVGLPGRR
ncbi:hypothetical protein B0A48_12714 [Cryoendolithus antarcticus]|uniref:mRNA 3'-end-processing protein RNA14 n=1 Tax=Cryoendolithus antarcticus TaxID=1507870 RepID=A0A1V8SR70_9PEZI|nr:hypothetical protein B0A48_12714 [Cryoendolithus antarcticus]